MDSVLPDLMYIIILIFHFSETTWHTYPTQFILPAHWYMKNYNTTGIMITQVKYNSCTFIPSLCVFLTLVVYMKALIRLLFWNKCLLVLQVVLPAHCDPFLLCWFYHFISVFWICFCLKLLWSYLCFWSLIYFDNEANSVMNIFWIML